jgi:acetolactate synthase I/II/III large subunit
MAGSRDGYIHWAQEMYDQAGLVRETTKWQYELHNGAQLQSVVDRALAIAASEPKGPVYLSLPREVIAAPMPPDAEIGPLRMQPSAPPAPDAAAIGAAAAMIAKAKSPLIVTANAGREEGAFAALAEFAGRFAIPVAQHKPRYLGLPSSHEMNLGFEPSRHARDADLIVALETDVPWIPKHGGPDAACPVIQCGVDPMYSHIPIRSFASDIAIAGSTTSILDALGQALDGEVEEAGLLARRERVAAIRAEMEAAREGVLDAARNAHPLHPAWVSHCIGAARDARGIVINEYTLLPEYVSVEQPDSYFGSSSVSGLGWGAGAALGAKLAAPAREVVAVLGDGAYMFSNPAAVHHASAMHKLPALFVVMNNSMWGAVRRSTVAMYPDGGAATSNDPDFVHLHDLPAFEAICESAGGYGERVDDAAELPEALERALRVVREEKRQALLNVMCAQP